MSQQVLIVEDDRSHSETLQMVLADYGYETTAIESGLDALPLVAADPPAVIVLDMMLPGRNGLEILLALGERYPDIPTIVVSAYPMERATRQVQALKHAPRHLQYLSKPYELSALYAAVERAVQGAPS